MISALENGMTTFLAAHALQIIDIVGTGIDDKGMTHKIEVIERVLAFHTLDLASGFEIPGITEAELTAA